MKFHPIKSNGKYLTFCLIGHSLNSLFPNITFMSVKKEDDLKILGQITSS